jgi:poly(A) polymerase Pap1
MYVHCIKMYIYCIYSTYRLYRSTCQLVVQSYAIQDEIVNSQEMHGLNWNFVFELHDFNLHDVFQECNPGIK